MHGLKGDSLNIFMGVCEKRDMLNRKVVLAFADGSFILISLCVVSCMIWGSV